MTFSLPSLSSGLKVPNVWQRTDVQALGICLFLPKYWLKDIYIPDCKISLASFVLYFHLLLNRSFIRIRPFFFVSWSLLKKLNLLFQI